MVETAATLTLDPEWRSRAACRSIPTRLFFPQGLPALEAQAACQRCEVRPECALAARGERHGWWAGQSRERSS